MVRHCLVKSNFSSSNVHESNVGKYESYLNRVDLIPKDPLGNTEYFFESTLKGNREFKEVGQPVLLLFQILIYGYKVNFKNFAQKHS